MELFANGALCLLLRLSVVAQNLTAHYFRDQYTAIIKWQRNIKIITKTVTIINYVQSCSIALCRQMPTNPEMYEMLYTVVDRSLSRKIEIVFLISSELLNFVVAKKYH